MPHYRIRLADGTARLADAPSPESVIARLGLDPLSVLAVEAAAAPRRAARGAELRVLVQSLAQLLDSGIPLLEAVQTLAEKQPQLASVQAALAEGQAFSTALASAGHDALLVALVAASERSGQLPRTLAQHADWLAWAEALRTRLVAASVYPLLLLAASGAVLLFLLLFVLPRFAGVFDGLQAELPAASLALLALGRSASAQPALTIALALALPTALLLVWHWPRARAAAAALAWRLPGLGERLRVVALARLYRCLALLLGAGIPVRQALDLVDAVLAGPLQPALRAAARAVDGGQRLSDALQAQGLATPVALRMLRVGERGGALATMLERAAAFHDEELARLADFVSRVLNPLLMLVMGVVIGGVVVLMYLPIFTLVENVQ
jgi:general secretion pathway protein F